MHFTEGKKLSDEEIKSIEELINKQKTKKGK